MPSSWPAGRDELKLRQEEFETVPVHVMVEVLVAAVLCMIGISSIPTEHYLPDFPRFPVVRHASHLPKQAPCIALYAQLMKHFYWELVHSELRSACAGSLSLAGDLKAIHASANQE